MRKISIALIFLLCSTRVFSQLRKGDLHDDVNRFQASKMIRNSGYECANGWRLDIGDTIQLDKGSLPNHKYAYIFKKSTDARFEGSIYLSPGEATRLVIKNFKIIGTRRGGFTAMARVGIGQLERYLLDIENAVESGEIIVPDEYRDKERMQVAPVDAPAADQIKKWKDLLDKGAITQEEYDAQKKKILGGQDF